MRASVGRLLCAAVLLPALLVAVAGAGFAGWRCHGLATVHASRCCPGLGGVQGSMDEAERDQSATAVARIAARRCCEVAQVRPVHVPSELSRAETTLLPPAASPSPAWALPPGGAGATFAAEITPRPGGGPHGSRAVLLRKQSFLI